MKTSKIVKQKDPLRQLLEAAENKVLIELIEDLAIMLPEARRECFEYLKAHVKLSPGQKETADGEGVFALWGELESDLAELDEYGGGDYDLADHVSDLLHEIVKKLAKNKVPQEYRVDLLDEVLPYLQSCNAGLEDDLYDVAYACCYNNDDLRRLAEDFEAMGGNWPMDNARRIYLKIGDKEKYLELRALKMEVGADYHELATFYWELGEKEKAIRTAKDGLGKGYGRLDELRQFLSERAQESGNRQEYIQLQFEQTVDHLTLKKYLQFRKLCTKDEWGVYENAVLKKLDRTWAEEKLKIYMHKKEYDKALTTLLKEGYPYHSYGDEYELKAASTLETRFPDKILGYYQSGLGNLNRSLTRKEYGRKAKVIKKVRHMYVDIMNKPEQWTQFARQVKLDNKKRPAFQEEFKKTVPGWGNL
ncbi:MAG: hypothetical protein H8E41_09420 [Desulfobulbaceae bacterium]|uniref:Uncharacterized protein n=1 Tax=Candidatus Desulfobia pelagia TaxID=2841692 RepID=A0A8J6NEZ8_9BACT|nr:hypothetical protein [Candidatus Desulfobia pelagia]